MSKSLKQSWSFFHVFTGIGALILREQLIIIIIIIDCIYIGLKPTIYINTYTSIIPVKGNPLSYPGPSLKRVQYILWYVQSVQVKGEKHVKN